MNNPTISEAAKKAAETIQERFYWTGHRDEVAIIIQSAMDAATDPYDAQIREIFRENPTLEKFAEELANFRDAAARVEPTTGDLVYENAAECLRLLEAAGMGKSGKGNCLVDMVREACERLRTETPPVRELPSNEIGVSVGPPEEDSHRFARSPKILRRYADDIDKYGRPLDSGLGLYLRFIADCIESVQGSEIPAGQTPVDSQEENKKPAGWIKTAERPPTKEGAWNCCVLVRTIHTLSIVHWNKAFPPCWTWWMPIPPVPRD